MLGEWHSKLTSGIYMHKDTHILHTYEPIHVLIHTYTKEKQYKASCQSHCFTVDMPLQGLVLEEACCD